MTADEAQGLISPEAKQRVLVADLTPQGFPPLGPLPEKHRDHGQEEVVFGDLPIGKVSEPVRTQFGFHIIKLTKRTDAAEKPGPEPETAAKNCLMASLQNEVFNQALTTCPIVMTETK